MAKREFIVKKPFKFNGESYGLREKITLDGLMSEQLETRIIFGVKWRFIVPLLAGKAVTLKDEMKGKKSAEHKDKPAPVKTDNTSSPAPEKEKGKGFMGKVADAVKGKLEAGPKDK